MLKNINTNFDYNQEIRKCKTKDDAMRKMVLFEGFVEEVLKNIFEEEMEEHLGKNKYERKETLSELKKNYEMDIVLKI